MSSQYVTRWPDNFQDVAITGTTVTELSNGGVQFANEMFSPGMPLCKWHSLTTFMDKGVKPTLPLLTVGKHYVIHAELQADHDPAVQLKLVFFDINHDELKTITATTLTKNFVYPEGAVSYEVSLINLNHLWINFEYLVIKEASDHRKIEVHLNRRGGLILVTGAKQTTGTVVEFAHGPLTTMEVPELESGQTTILAYVNDSNVDEVLAQIKQKITNEEITTFNYFRDSAALLNQDTKIRIEAFKNQI